MSKISNTVYHNGEYIVIRTTYPKHRPYRVSSKDYQVHTHIKSRKEAIDIANFAKHEQIPKKANLDYLVSLLRIAKNNKYAGKIMKEIEKISRNYK